MVHSEEAQSVTSVIRIELGIGALVACKPNETAIRPK